MLLYVKEGLCMNCYQCDSRDHPDCKENFDFANLDSVTIQSTECTVDAARYCVKTTGVWGGVVGTTRFCSSRDMGKQCQFIRYPDHDRVYRACIYTCGSDGCNGATTVSLSSLSLGFSLVVALLMYTRNL